MATTVLGGTNLPQVAQTGFRRSRTYRGGVNEMADGTVVFDLVQSAAKHTFVLEWRAITSAQVSTIETAFAAIDDGSASFTAPTGVTYTVTRDPANPELEIEPVDGSRGTRWDVRMALREA